MPKETIGPRIKAFRKGRGLTQSELALALGYSHKSVIAHIEKGESEMSYEKILLLLRTYALDANELFDTEQFDRMLEEHRKAQLAEARRNAWVKDILFDVDEQVFSYRVGGVLIKGNEILLTKDGDSYSLPGGHVQIGETSAEALIREFKEETGLDVEPLNVLSTFENFFPFDGRQCHQLCVYYRLKMADEAQAMVLQPDTPTTEYVWIALKELKALALYPIGIADQILNGSVDSTHTIYKE